jgi:hypothetical protein
MHVLFAQASTTHHHRDMPPKQRVYAVCLSGQGDTYEAIVDADIWEWIVGPPKSSQKAGVFGLHQVISENSWPVDEDPGVPQKVLDAIAEEDGEPDITIGSYENDRAMLVCAYDALCIYKGEDRGDARMWARDNNADIIETFEGYIY